MSARANTPGVAKVMKELEVQTPPKAIELEETVTQEEGETYHTRSKGRHDQKEGREQRSTTRAEASAIANPEEFRIEEDAARNGCQNIRGAKTWKNPRGLQHRGERGLEELSKII